MSKTFKRVGDNLVITIPLHQHKNNPYDEEEEKELTDNLVGVIVRTPDGRASFEQGFYQLNDLSYKDDTQLGMPIVMTYFSDVEFRSLCKELNILVWDFDACAVCYEPLWGTHTINKKGQSVCEGHDE